MNYFPEPLTNKNKIEVELDLFDLVLCIVITSGRYFC